MEIKTHEINEILRTLPIGYYCGRKIDVSLNEKFPTSAYSPTTDEIIISPNIIKEGLKNVEETPEYTRETAIRSMLYHELSHAILTPSDWNMRIHHNVFEDERIETLLKGYYMDTNFKQNLLNLQGGEIKVDWNNPDSVFYAAVRFRAGKPEHVQRVQEIIDQYDWVNSSTERDRWSSNNSWCGYENAIDDLYNTIVRDVRNQTPQNKDEQDKKNSDATDGMNDMAREEEKIMKDNEEKRASAKPKPGQGQEKEQNGQEQEGQGQSQQSRQGQKGKEDPNGEPVLGKAAGMDMLKNALHKTESKYRDPVLGQQLEMIFANFNKKNCGGNSVVSYSGRINPRNLIRDDYKIFDKKVSINGNNKYGTCHLNLFIDDSGSFGNHKDRVNVLIAELGNVEKHNKNFTFDLIRCGNGMTETDRTHRYIEANGGTHLEFEETRRIFNKHQKKNTMVYNIVLYDGECSPYGRSELGYYHPFKYFDKKNTTMILEEDNREYIERCGMTNANIIYENRDYTRELTKHVLRALTIAFR